MVQGVQLVLDPSFGWVLIAQTAIILECLLISIIVVGMAKRKCFTEEFLEQNFGDIHFKEFGSKIGKGGYPDMGSGVYSNKLSYKQWFELNTAQRTHLNFLEQLGLIIPTQWIAGLYFPVATAYLGLTYFIGRIFYTIGYQSQSGPQNRAVGFLLCILSLTTTIILAFISGSKFTYGEAFVQ